VAKLQPEETTPDLKILVSLIETLPSEIQITLQGAVTQVNDTLNRRRQIMQLVNDAFGQLRLDMKYLMFDLEATRRERDTLKNKLGEE